MIRPFLRAALFGIGLAAISGAGHAQPAPDDAGRFTLQPVEGGLLKLDTRSGAMSFCRARDGAASSANWVCEAVPEDRAALEAEITRLHDRIAALENRGVPDIMAPPVPVPDKTQPSTPPQASKPLTPEEERGQVREAMDQAMDMAEHAFRRFMEMVNRLRSDPPASERL